jgi:hypothetical protein
MRKMLNVVAAALCIFGAVGCGGTIDLESEESLASTEQPLSACINDGSMAGKCTRSTETCVARTTCRPKCSYPSLTCGSGQKCCWGYVYPDGSAMAPYCLSTSSTCWSP